MSFGTQSTNSVVHETKAIHLAIAYVRKLSVSSNNALEVHSVSFSTWCGSEKFIVFVGRVNPVKAAFFCGWAIAKIEATIL